MKARGFMGSNYFPSDSEKMAIAQLKRMAVYHVMNSDWCYYHTFDDVWYAVWDECDIFKYYLAKGGLEAYQEFLGSSVGLRQTSYRRAVKWLRESVHLVSEKPVDILRWL